MGDLNDKNTFSPLKPMPLSGNMIPHSILLREVPIKLLRIIAFLFRIPFQPNYRSYINKISARLEILYCNCIDYLCKSIKIEPRFLLNFLNLIAEDQISQQAFFPGMNIRSNKELIVLKIEMVKLT